MEKHNFKSFAQKLVLSLLSALIFIFCLLFAFIYFSSKQYMKENASANASNIAANIIRTMERRIQEIERMPPMIYSFTGPYDTVEITQLPYKVLRSYPNLLACFVQYNSSSPKAHLNPHLHAIRVKHDSITYCSGKNCLIPDSSLLFRINEKNGSWFFKNRHPRPTTLCYCEPFLDNQGHTEGILGFEFPISQLIDFTEDIKIYNAGYLFFTDVHGNFVSNFEDPLCPGISNLPAYSAQKGIRYAHVTNRVLNGDTGSDIIHLHHTKNFIFYTPVAALNWRLAIVCPYDAILISSSRFYNLIFLVCAVAMLFLMWSLFKIVYKFSRPLKIFARNVQKIQNGQFDFSLFKETPNDEIGELQEAFRHMQKNINAYAEQLKVSAVNNEKMQMEIRLAQKLQNRFLPKPIRLPNSIELCSQLKQSKSVGGDLYEYFVIGNNLYFAIGDVSGKGIPAALYMASIIKLFRYVASRQTSTATICTTINSYMCDNTDDDMYMTMFVGILNMTTGVITFTNAGHPEPLIIHPNAQINQLHHCSDVPIGILEDYKFNEYTYTLTKGSQIFLYTDGITDAENKNGQFYRLDKLTDSIHRSPSLLPTDIVNTVVNDIYKYIGDINLSDDFTVLSILYKGKTFS